MSDGRTYVLGTAEAERERLKRQHAIWRDDCLRGWRRAGFSAGQRLLDLGCGPGFAALDLAELVGPQGQVLAIDSASAYLQHLREESPLPQLHTLEHDLATPLPPGVLEPHSWDGAWCRWVAMFLPRLEPLLDLLEQALRPGARLVLHEYVQWDTFALYPQGPQLAQFVQRCIRHWQDHGGDPHVARRLPALLEARGFRLLHSSSLMACSAGDHPKALWLQDFLTSYPAQLSAAGHWSPEEQAALEAELQQARRRASLWVSPALVELVWEHR